MSDFLLGCFVLGIAVASGPVVSLRHGTFNSEDLNDSLADKSVCSLIGGNCEDKSVPSDEVHGVSPMSREKLSTVGLTSQIPYSLYMPRRA